MQCAAPRIRPHRQVSRIHVSQRVEPQHRRIHPTVHRDIRAAIRVSVVRVAIRRHRRVGNLRRRRRGRYHRRWGRLRNRRSLPGRFSLRARLRIGPCSARGCRNALSPLRARRLLPIARHRLDPVLALRSRNRRRRRGRRWSSCRSRSVRGRLRRRNNPQAQNESQARNARKPSRDISPHTHLGTVSSFTTTVVQVRFSMGMKNCHSTLTLSESKGKGKNPRICLDEGHGFRACPV